MCNINAKPWVFSIVALASMAPAWGQIAIDELVPPNFNPRGSFGYAMVGDEVTLAVSAKGGLEIFDLRSGEPSWLQTLTLDDFPIWAGVTSLPQATSLAGEYLAFGHPTANVDGLQWAGAAYVFHKDVDGWEFQQRLTAATPQAMARFGNAIDFDGASLVVGAPYANGGAGAVHVIRHSVTGWTEEQVLGAVKPNAKHGSGVAVDGEWLFVAASHLSDAWFYDAYVHFYRRDSSNPTEPWTLAKSLPVPVSISSNFGYLVDLDGEHAVAADPGNLSAGAVPSGPVRVYRRFTDGNWHQSQLLPQPDADETGPNSTGYGWSLDLRGSDLVIGSPMFMEWGGTPGAAYHFRLNGLQWKYVGKVLPAHLERLDWLGTSIHLLGDRVHIGAMGQGSQCGIGWLGFLMCLGPGAVFEFDLSADGEQYCSCGALGICGNPDGHGGCKNSTDNGAILASAGTGSLAADDLRLQAFAMPPHQIAVLSIGTQALSTPFGDGRLCIGGSVLHFPALTTGERGRVDVGPGVAGAANALGAGIQAGEPRYFQVFYRDPGGPCGSGVNLTNAVRVDFKP